MRVVAFSFPEAEAALEARQDVRVRFAMQPDDALVGDLADDGWVLGVRVPEDELQELAHMLNGRGGKELVDVPERWTELAQRNVP